MNFELFIGGKYINKIFFYILFYIFYLILFSKRYLVIINYCKKRDIAYVHTNSYMLRNI